MGKKKIPGGRRIAILLLFPHLTELSLLQSSNPIFMSAATVLIIASSTLGHYFFLMDPKF